MSGRYLEITYRRGIPMAAYYYLPRRSGDTSVRTVRGDAGLLTDYASDGRPIGIEITSPGLGTLPTLNAALAEAAQSPATPDDLAPLLAVGRRIEQGGGSRS